MKNPYYDTTVPVFIKTLENLDHILSKAAAFAVEKGISEETMLGNRLAPDMFPLSRQIQIATDNAKISSARLCGTEAPVFEDTEITVAELHERIAKTIAYLQTLTPEAFEGAEERQIFVKYYPEKHFVGYTYLAEYGIPNFFFHVTIAYALIRALGADIGKSDYLGHLSLLDN